MLVSASVALTDVSSFPGHAKEALNLAQMQEQTVQLEQQSKLKVSGSFTSQLYVALVQS